MMSIDIGNIEVEVKGRFTSLILRGDVSYGFCYDVTFGEPNLTRQFSLTIAMKFTSMCYLYSRLYPKGMNIKEYTTNN